MASLKLFGGFLIIIILLVFALSYQKPLSTEDGTVKMTGLFVNKIITRYPVFVEVVEMDNETIGIVAEGYLNFGRVPSGINVRKNIKLSNDDQTPMKIHITKEGDVAPYIGISKDNFILVDEEEIEIMIETSDIGNFSGAISIEVIKPNNWLSGWLIQWI